MPQRKAQFDRIGIGPLLAPDISQFIADRQFREVQAALADLMNPDVADVLDELDPQERVVAFRLLSPERAADVFTLLPEDQQNRLLQELEQDHLAEIFKTMEPDDRTDLLGELPEEQVRHLLGILRPEERREAESLLEYPPDSVGHLITPRHLTVRPEWTAQRVLDHVREQGEDAETLEVLYVIDEDGRLLDDLPLRDVLLSPPQQRVDALTDGQVAFLRASEDREEAVRMMDRYDEAVLPVVDERDVLVGIVTFDDIADVATEEVTEDIHKLGGLAALDQPYLSMKLSRLVSKRVGWLAMLFVAGLGTVTVMAGFEARIEEIAILAVFVPLIIATGGNSGFQAATVMTRAFALKDVEGSDWLKVTARELASGVMLGTVLAVLGFVMATLVGMWMNRGQEEFLLQSLPIGVAVGVSVLCVVVFGNMVGSLLPFALRGLGADPATSSTPFVATIADVCGLLIYFFIATSILGL
jgi:magnesium transporter